MDYQLIIDYMIGRWGYSKQFVRNNLAPFKGKHVDVLISSPGGDLDHALDIRQQFADHGDVTVHITGFTASAATVIAMGAKRVCMSKFAMFKVHKCSNFIDVWGNYNADEMQKLIEDLTENKKENDKIDVVLANLYATRCKKKVSEILDILKADRWLTAQEALDLGFIDEIREADANEVTWTSNSPDTARKLNALGLGVEGIPSAAVTDEEKASLWEKLKKSLFHSEGGKENTADDQQGQSETLTNTTTEMKTIKLTAAMAAVLAVESIEADDKGTVTLSEAQVNDIASKLEALTADVTAKENSIKELQEKVASLEKLPADSTDDVKDDGSEEKLNASDMYNSIKDIL